MTLSRLGKRPAALLALPAIVVALLSVGDGARAAETIDPVGRWKGTYWAVDDPEETFPVEITIGGAGGDYIATLAFPEEADAGLVIESAKVSITGESCGIAVTTPFTIEDVIDTELRITLEGGVEGDAWSGVIETSKEGEDGEVLMRGQFALTRETTSEFSLPGDAPRLGGLPESLPFLSPGLASVAAPAKKRDSLYLRKIPRGNLLSENRAPEPAEAEETTPRSEAKGAATDEMR